MGFPESPGGHPLQAPPAARDLYRNAPPDTTLAALDDGLGFHAVAEPGAELRHLWYQSVKDMPVPSLGDEDLAAVLDEGIHLPVVLPVALERLREWPSRPSVSLVELIRACARASRWVKGSVPALGRECRVVLERIASRSEPPSQATIRAAVVAALADLEALEPPPFPRRVVPLPAPPTPTPPPRQVSARASSGLPSVRNPHLPFRGSSGS